MIALPWIFAIIAFMASLISSLLLGVEIPRSLGLSLLWALACYMALFTACVVADPLIKLVAGGVGFGLAASSPYAWWTVKGQGYGVAVLFMLALLAFLAILIIYPA